ncbi:MAG TPA: phenylacetic acid degradation protein PaaY [Burkholderiales bacterium]|nr:phenylacetic acid degradation protein PaaY [Burkholderiales bacterium]
MLKVYAIDGIVPVVHPAAYVHPSAVLIGDVIVAAGVYVGPCACLRGDFGRIVIEQGANVQDCCILHAFPDRDLVVEADGHIGHGAVLHGCVVKSNAMVGINSVVNDNAVVGESSIVGAMAFVKAGFEVPPKSLVLGVPGKVVRELSAEEMAWKRDATRQYQELARRSLATMRETVALAEVEPARARFRDASVMPLSEMKKASPK